MFTKAHIAGGVACCLIILAATALMAAGPSAQGEELYRYLSQKTTVEGDAAFVRVLNESSLKLDWSNTTKSDLTGQPPDPQGQGRKNGKRGALFHTEQHG